MKPDYILKPGMNLLGIEKLRAHQLKPIQSLMQGNDTIVIAGTASGKSAIYQLPALVHSDQLTLVVEPTLSLIYNQVQSLQECGIHADYIDHFRTKKDVDAILHKVKKRKLTFLYVTPERLQNRQFQQIGRGGRDEKIHAHCVLFYDHNGDDDKIVNSFIKKAAKKSEQAVSILTANYNDMRSFVESGNCMVQDALAYQGQIEKKTCKTCTNCAKNRR